jgi:hypothetical protein
MFKKRYEEEPTKDIQYYKVDKCTRQAEELNRNTGDQYKDCVKKHDKKVETIRHGENHVKKHPEYLEFTLNENTITSKIENTLNKSLKYPEQILNKPLDTVEKMLIKYH